MKNKKFDQELKTELEGYQSSADPAAIWAAIGSEVDQINEAVEEENKKPMVWIFSLLSIGLLMVLAIGWNINASESKRPLVNDFDNKIKIEESIESNNKTSLAISNAQNQNVSVNERTLISDQDFYTKKEVSNIYKKINQADPKENERFFLKKKQIAKKQFFIPIAILENKQLVNDPSNPLASIVAPEIIPTPSFADRRRRRTPAWNLGLEIQGGASLTNRKLSLVGNENSAYLSLREATESALETIQIGGKIELQHRTGFSISTGIQWSRITEKYSIEEKTMEDRLENTLVSYSLDMNQDTVNRTYDDIVRTSTTTTTREGYNRYRLLDIPLLFGYHFKNENWSIGLETGILANLNLSTKGFVYDENSQLIDLSTDQKTVFKASAGMGFYLGATGRVALTDNIQVSINPFYRINGGSFSITENPIAQKYSWIGLNIGLRYGF